MFLGQPEIYVAKKEPVSNKQGQGMKFNVSFSSVCRVLGFHFQRHNNNNGNNNNSHRNQHTP